MSNIKIKYLHLTCIGFINTNDQFLLFFNRFAINPSSALKLTEGTRAYFISQDASDVSK